MTEVVGSPIGATSLGIGITLFMAVCLLVLPRRLAPAPILFVVCYVTMGQQVDLMGLNFTMFRAIIVIGCLRVLVRLEWRGLDFNIFDRLLLIWVVVSMIAYIALWQSGDAVINRFGMALNVLGSYFLFRCLIRDADDIKRTVQIMAVLTVPLAAVMLYEKSTGWNGFSLLGGVSPFTAIRDGKFRCQGPFGHPILAGVFGAVTLSWYIGLLRFKGRGRPLAFAAILASLAIVAVSASTTPLLSAVAAIGAICFWPMREWMRPLRWAALVTVVVLHFVMNAPVWFIIARVSMLPSSTAYHRAVLVDRAITRIGEWWLVGTRSTAHWGHQMFDVANQYVRVAVDGGLLALMLFLGVIALGFGAVGRLAKRPGDWPTEWRFFTWTLGAALFAHVVTFWGVSYWDQVSVIWYLELALLGTARSIANAAAAQPTAVGVAAVPTALPATPSATSGGRYSRRPPFVPGRSRPETPRFSVPPPERS